MTTALLNSVMEIAQQMIEVGAEIHRVEDSVERICRAYDTVRTDVYATTSNIVVSVENTDGQVLTQTRRIQAGGTDIDRLDKLNSLARYITAHKPDEAYIRTALSQIAARRPYAAWLHILCYGGIAGAFCLFFGARNLPEIAVALVIGLIVGVVALLLERLTINKILGRLLCSFVSAFLALTAVRTGLIATPDNVIIGNIMTLIPGIGLTNSLRDLFTGDTVTGILRSIEAILLALAIAGGYVLAVVLLGGVQ